MVLRYEDVAFVLGNRHRPEAMALWRLLAGVLEEAELTELIRGDLLGWVGRPLEELVGDAELAAQIVTALRPRCGDARSEATRAGEPGAGARLLREADGEALVADPDPDAGGDVGLVERHVVTVLHLPRGQAEPADQVDLGPVVPPEQIGPRRPPRRATRAEWRVPTRDPCSGEGHPEAPPADVDRHGLGGA